MVAQKKPIVLDFADMSGGCNSIEHPIRYNGNQVDPRSVGYILRRSGIIKYPGAQGLSDATTFDKYLRLVTSHAQYDGTENLYALCNGKLELVDTDDGALTEKYDMGEAGNEGSATDAYGKKFICNGNKCVKIEGTTALQVGISAPSGVTGAAAAGAGLPDGVYSVYVSYARKVSGSNVLYSKGQSVGSITLGGGNNRISLTFANSADAQVTNKVVWIKSPGELIHYFFHETGDNTTTAITISATTLKATGIVYEYVAAPNELPPAITYIFAFAGRLWGIVGNTVWYSNMGGFNEYDVEIWAPANFRKTPYRLTGIFSVGQNLYFNTTNGILLLPNGDVTQMMYLIERRWYFKYMNTVSPWNNGVIGVTNDGVRLFDGESFTSFDMAYPIRDILSEIYDSPANFQPCGFVYRRSFRDEYHLMWQDSTVSVTVNNRHAVLNLSSVSWASTDEYKLAWEFQHVSGNYAAVFRNNALYIGQTHETASKIYLEDRQTTQSINCYDKDGNLFAVQTDMDASLYTKQQMFGMNAVMWLEKFYTFAQNDFPFSVQVYSGDDINKFSNAIEIPASSGGGAPAKFDAAIFDESTFPSENATTARKKLPTDFRTQSFYIVIKQSANDVNFKLIMLNIFAKAETGNYL
jgi:hypothetical protein